MVEVFDRSLQEILSFFTSAFWEQRRAIPVFIGFAIFDAPHVEPGGRIGFSFLVWIREFSHRGDSNKVAFGSDGDNFGFPLGWSGNRSRWHSREELHDRSEATRHVRVVLEVALADVLWSVGPVTRLQQVANDVEHNLLVGVELFVGTRE